MMLASNGGMRALAEQQDSTQEEDLFALSLEDLVTLDFNLLYKVQEKLSFSLRVDNIFDKEYEHPGIRNANSGADPGYWDAGGAWQGSQGWFNSVVPQPGRTVWLSASIGL